MPNFFLIIRWTQPNVKAAKFKSNKAALIFDQILKRYIGISSAKKNLNWMEIGLVTNACRNGKGIETVIVVVIVSSFVLGNQLRWWSDDLAHLNLIFWVAKKF